MICPASERISQPSDLIGRTIGSPAGSASDKLFNAFLAANHLKRRPVGS